MMDGVFDFDEVLDRRGTASEKWEKYRGRDILPMWVADMDFRSPPAVIEALHRRTEHGVFGYTGPPPELVAATLSMLDRDYDWQVDPDWIVWLPGLVSGLNVTCRAVGEDGDEVLTLTPVYPPFLSAPGNSRRGVVRVPLREENNRWGLDFERLEAAVTPRTRLFMLCRGWPNSACSAESLSARMRSTAGFCSTRTNATSRSRPSAPRSRSAPSP
jgi:cystathionine beta-lyase